MGFWDKPTQTRKPPEIAPTTKSGAMEFRVGEGLTDEQTQTAYEKIANPDTAMKEGQAMTFWGKVKNEFTPQPVSVRRLFEAEPTELNAPPIVAQAGSFGFRLIEAIPRAVATFGGEIKGGFKPNEVEANIDLRRLGFETPNYVTAAKEQQDAINRGENAWISGLGIISNKTLDIAFGASLLSDLAKISTSILVSGGVEARIEAQNIVDAYKTKSKEAFARLKNAPLEERERAMAEITNLKNEAEKVLKTEGAPTAIDRARVNTARYTEVLGRETPITKDFWGNIIKPNIELKTPVVAKAPVTEFKQLGGTREVPNQAPAFGLSMKEIENVGKTENNLIVVHNLNETKLRFADKIGGLANPSMAIFDPKITPFENYGDISLIGDKNLIEGQKTHLADAYSPRFPSVHTTMKWDDFKRLETDLQPYYDKIGKDVRKVQHDDSEMIRNIENSPAVALQFLEIKGIKPSKEGQHYYHVQIRENKLDAEFQNFLDNLYKKYNMRERMFAGYTGSGQRRYKEVSVEEASKIMNKQKEEGFNYGLGSYRSKVAPIKKTASAIKKEAGRLVSKEQFELIKEQHNNELFELRDMLEKYAKNKDSNSFIEMDRQLDTIGAILSGEKDAWKYFDNKFENVPQNIKDKILAFKEKLKNMPTEYFETKFKRPVSLSEFKIAVVPEGISSEARAILEKQGLQVITFAEGKKQEVLKQLLSSPHAFSRPTLFLKDIEKTPEEIRQIIIKTIEDAGFDKKDLKIFFDDTAGKDALGNFEKNNRLLGDVIRLYEKDGKVGVATALHETKHFLFSRLSPEMQKEALAQAKKEIGVLYKTALKKMYKEKGVYAGANRENALLEEYIVDRWAKAEATAKYGFKKSISGRIFDALDAILTKIVKVYEKVKEYYKSIPNKQGGFAKLPQKSEGQKDLFGNKVEPPKPKRSMGMSDAEFQAKIAERNRAIAEYDMKYPKFEPKDFNIDKMSNLVVQKGDYVVDREGYLNVVTSVADDGSFRDAVFNTKEINGEIPDSLALPNQTRMATADELKQVGLDPALAKPDNFVDEVIPEPPAPKEVKTQKQKVVEAVKEAPKTIKEVAEETKIKEPNVRRILGVGAKEGTFERVDTGVYRLKKNGKEIVYIETGNALEVLPRLVKEGFKSDMVFLDIPYNAAGNRGGNRMNQAKKTLFKTITPDEFGTFLESVSQALRTPESPLVYMFSQSVSSAKTMKEYADKVLEAGFIPLAKGDYYKMTSKGTRFTKPMRTEPLPPEGIIIFNKTGQFDFKGLEGQLPELQYKLVRPRGWQTEKPVELLNSLIKMTTNEGDVVLDPFAGSGVTGEQALKLGRKTTAIEISPKAVEEHIKPRFAKASEQFKVGDVLDPQGKTNMEGVVTIREIAGNTLKFTDAKGNDFAGMSRSTVRELIKEGSWKRVTEKPVAPVEVKKPEPRIAKPKKEIAMSEADKTKMEGLKEMLENIKDQLANHPARPLLKFQREGQFMDFRNPDLAKTSFERNRIIKTNKKIMKTAENAFGDTQYSDLFDNPDAIREVIDNYKRLRETEKAYVQDIKKLENEYITAIREKRTQEIIDKISEKLEAQRQKMVDFAEKHPRLSALITPMSKEMEIGAKKGYKLGVEVGAKKTKTELIASFNEKNLNVENTKRQIIDYANEHLSLAEKGKLITVVRDAKTPRDLAKAFMRIDRRVEEITLSNAIKELKNTAEKLAESPAVSVDYRNKIKDVISEYELSGHTQATIDKLKATQQYIDNAKADGKDVEIPQRIFDKLDILSRVPKDELTLSQVTGLKNEIELLGKLGETKWKTKQALYDGEKALRKQALLDSATPINSMELPKKVIGSKVSKWVKKYIQTRNYLQKSNLALTPIEGLADLTGMLKMKADLDLNFGNYLSYNDQTIKNWYDITRDFTEKEFERIGTYAIAKQSGGIERLANSGITKEEIDAIVLTPAEEKAYQFVRDTFENEYPLVKKYVQDIYNKDVGQVDNYVSFMSNYDEMNDLEMYDRFGQIPQDIGDLKTKTVEQGFTKSRAGLSKIKLELDINKIFRRHIDDVAYLVTSGRDIKMYSEIVNSPEMTAKLGDVGTLAWKQWLDLMARKGGSEGAKRIAGLDIVRKNVGAGILAFRLSSALVQFSSFADTIATIGAEWASKGAGRIATSREWRDFVMDNFPEVRKAVGDDIAFREFGEDLLGKMTRIGLTPLQALDGLMRSTAIAGAYEKLAFEKGIKVDLNKPDPELVQRATKLMRQSQGSSFFKDQPLAITTGYGLLGNKSINKTLLTFQSFMLNRWDNIKRQIWRMGIKEKDYTKAGMSFFWLIIVASAMEEGIRRGGRAIINLATGDDQEEKSFFGNTALNIVQNVPILGSLVSAMTYSSNPVPVINTFEEVLGGAKTATTGKEMATKAKGLTTVLGGVGSLSGVPGASQLAQIIKKAIPTEEKKRAEQMAKIKPTYDKVQKLKETDPTEAQSIVDNLNDADYELYKQYKQAETAKKTIEGKKTILPTYEKIQKLNKTNPEEALKMLNALTDDEYHYYELVKKQKAKEKLIAEGEAPTFDSGSTESPQGIIDTAITYAQALGTDPVTAFNRIFTGQRIRYVTNGAIVVERMSLDASQSVKEERGGKTSDLKLDHVIPLQLGGSNSKDNLALVPTSDWNTYTPVENYLGKQLRNGIISKKEAQDLIVKFKSGEITSQDVFDYKQ